MASRERWGRPDRTGSRGRPARPERPEIEPGHGSAGRGAAARGSRSACRRSGRDHGTDAPGRAAAPHASIAAHRRRPPRRAPRRPRGGRRRPARAAVRRVPRRRRPRDRREGRPVPRRRRPVRLERPAQALGGARGRRARPARAGAHPLGPRARARTTSTTGRRSIARTTSRRWPAPPAEEMVTVLTPDHPWVHLAGARRRRPRPLLPDQARAAQPAARPRRRRDAATPPGTSASSTRPSPSPAARTTTRSSSRSRRSPRAGLDYLALGHWHCAQVAKTKGVTYAYAGRARAGRRRPGQGRQGAPGDARRRQAAQHTVEVEERIGRQDDVRAPRDRRGDHRVAAGARRDSSRHRARPGPRPRRPAHRRPARRARPRHRPRSSRRSRASYLRVRVRDVEPPGADRGRAPAAPRRSPGAFIRNVEGRIADLEATGDDMARREAEELRDVLRLGRLLLAGSRGDAVRITSLALTDLRRYRDADVRAGARPDDRPRPQRGRQVDDPAGDRARR